MLRGEGFKLKVPPSSLGVPWRREFMEGVSQGREAQRREAQRWESRRSELRVLHLLPYSAYKERLRW